MKSAVVFSAIILGIALFIASALWGTLFPATASWTPDKAARISEIKARLSDLSAQLYSASNRPHGGADPGPVQAEYDKLLREYEELKVDFESAESRPRTISTVLKWIGISIAVLGIMGWYAVNQSS